MERLLMLLLLVGAMPFAEAQSREAVVADAETRQPLSGASVFDHAGKFIGVSRSNGRLPYVSAADYPIVVRFMGFKEMTVKKAVTDTIFMWENATELPEVVVESRQHKMLHILGYVREYSTLSTYSDTVFLFREKMVDYMLPTEVKTRFKGWANPRVLNSRSYYRFTDAHGLDSVSDRCSHYFSWADWMGVVPAMRIPERICDVDAGTDTVMGKYSPTEMWLRANDRVTLDVNVLADTMSRRWVPNLSVFFRDDIDFDQFRVRYNYDNIADNMISPMDLTGYSFNIESTGRGRNMFMFNRHDEKFYVNTYAEVYVLDKEYITVKEARKWERLQTDGGELAMYEPAEAPELQPAILRLVDRVNLVDHDEVRLAIAPDRRFVSRNVVKTGFGHRILSIVKNLTGISSYKAKRNLNRYWRDFSKERIKRNKQRYRED